MIHALAAAVPPAVATPALGPKWMDPEFWLNQYQGAFIWVALAIVFVECGLFFPFLPGDSLLFAMGLFVATGKVSISLALAIPLLFVAAFLGNVVGYEIGRAIGAPLYEREGRVIKREYFEKSNDFFERHGSKALVIGRFVPIVRTFITIVAGVSRMSRRHFYTWSAVGAALWVLLVTLAGYFLGKQFPWLQEKIDVAILLIVLVSVLPMVFEWVKHRRGRSQASPVVEESRVAGKDLIDREFDQQ